MAFIVGLIILIICGLLDGFHCGIDYLDNMWIIGWLSLWD